jgi:membrane-associated phospholipid phosphatase
MQSIWDSGIQFILAFQTVSWLVAPMKFFSFLGSEEFFMFMLPLLYWCVDTALGLRVGLILLFSTWLNDVLKILFNDPRPYWISTDMNAYANEASFGVPSGHSQTAVAVWGMIAYYVNRRWVWVSCVVVMILIGLSRMYIGVHFPTDVLIGWLVGGILLVCFIKFWNPVADWLKRLTFVRQVLVAFLVSLGFIGTVQLSILSLGDWSMPEEWLLNSAAAFPEGPEPDPVDLSGAITTAGTLFGLSLGLAWFTRRGGFSVEGSLGQRAARFLVGLVGLGILYLGLKLIFPSGDGSLPYFFRYLRYSLVGVWVSAGAPWLFVRMKLAKPKLTTLESLS